jgi:hypothetical protein
MGRDTLVINFFGGPGCGKSTMAANLFAEMKYLGLDVELVTEYCKTFTYRPAEFPNQEKIFLNQTTPMLRCYGKVDFIVTDAPVFLSYIYGGNSFKLPARAFHRYLSPSFNIFIKRVKGYNPLGRIHSESEAIEKDKEIKTAFTKAFGKFSLEVPGVRESVSHILGRVIFG